MLNTNETGLVKWTVYLLRSNNQYGIDILAARKKNCKQKERERKKDRERERNDWKVHPNIIWGKKALLSIRIGLIELT